jgi:1-pyrroline dehydrogenase
MSPALVEHEAISVPSEGAGSEGTALLRLVNPADGSPVADLTLATPADVDRAVAAAVAALPAWGGSIPQERARCLLELANELERNAEELALLESADVGKPIAAAREELPLIVDTLRFFAGAARVSHGGTAGEYSPGSTSYLRREPVGVVGQIAPWNYPLLEAVWKIAPALAAGNTVVLKPSEVTPLTTIRLGQLAEAILPEGVLNIVLGDRRTGEAIVAHPDVAMVSLTGAVATGMKVAATAAQGLKRVHLELGGKAPVLVCDDVDVDAAVPELAAAGFVNAGQDCTAACRLIVADSIYERFVEAYVEAATALVVGDPGDEATDLGPVVSETQLERVAAFVEGARQSGASVRCGGHRLARPGFYYAPTVITDVAQDAEIVQNEVFGPVVTIQRAASDDEMLRMANDVAYGLSASVWTNGLERTQTFTTGLAFGTVWVNQHLLTVSEMPFGGFGQSGYGKEMSIHALDDYSRLKHVMVKARV